MNFNEPVLFNESKAAALGYPEDCLPDELWAASPRDLHNANESDVFTYLWDEITAPENAAQIVKECRPYITLGDLFFVAKEKIADVA